MRTKEDNLLKIANSYESSMIDDGIYDEFSDDEMRALFNTLVSDYRKVVKICKKDGIDVGDAIEDVDECVDAFEEANFDNREEVLDKVKERILILINLCDEIPDKIMKKYCEKDLLDIIESE